jgi:DNA primase
MTLLQELIQEDFGISGNNRWFSSVEHSSLVYDSDKDIFFWNSQNIRGDVLEYLIKVRGISRKKAEEILKTNTRVVGSVVEETETGDTKPYEKLVDLLWTLGKDNRDYWYKRCLTDRTIDNNRLGFYNGWNLIPLTVGEKFVNFQCRRDDPKRIQYWYRHKDFQPVILNQEILQLVDTIFITEGPVDSILLNQEGIPTVSHTGGSGYWNPIWYPLFQRIKNIYYIQDNDSAGLWGSKRVSEGLGVNRVKIFQFDNDIKGYDAGNYFQEGGNATEFKEMVETNSKYSFEIGDLSDKKRNNQKIRRSNREFKSKW